MFIAKIEQHWWTKSQF